jgi:isocitrate dehydrogenase kinase/phosphatase
MAERFRALTRRARIRFESRDWAGIVEDAGRRLALYSERTRETTEEVERILGDRLRDKTVWAAMKAAYSAYTMDRQDFELAETYFNSITRRTFDTVGVDPRIEFVDTDFDIPPTESPTSPYRSYEQGTAEQMTESAILDVGFRAPFVDLAGDVELVGSAMRDRLRVLGSSPAVDRLDVASHVFYRGKGAYLVGRIVSGEMMVPMAIALEHGEEGMYVDAVLLSENDVSILFSFAHSYFHVEGDRPYDLVRFVQELVPRKRLSELYISVGRPRHGKTELFRELLDALDMTTDLFIKPPGKEGLVMSVFTLPGFEMVFKVIKDTFPPQKTMTPTQVMDKYRLVYHHDRAGRLVDSQSFEHLQFDADRFEPELLEELLTECSRTVHREGDKVAIARTYVQRRVDPLDVYLGEVEGEVAAAAVVDYGDAIRDLAVTGIFPGDLLIKNFGVTRNDRVVFYDYDELMEIVDCHFREMPVPSSIDDAMAETPWFPLGPDDIFPSEFSSFLGLRGELRETFLDRHGELLEASWWKEIQGRILSGEIVSIYPYARGLRLGV